MSAAAAVAAESAPATAAVAVAVNIISLRNNGIVPTPDRFSAPNERRL
jgi:hypothetical protein